MEVTFWYIWSVANWLIHEIWAAWPCFTQITRSCISSQRNSVKLNCLAFFPATEGSLRLEVSRKRLYDIKSQGAFKKRSHCCVGVLTSLPRHSKMKVQFHIISLQFLRNLDLKKVTLTKEIGGWVQGEALSRCVNRDKPNDGSRRDLWEGSSLSWSIQGGPLRSL